jgi:hypothetical protein
LIDNRPPPLLKQRSHEIEETKATTVARGSRYENKFEQFKKNSYVTPTMMGMVKQTAPVPQKSKHMMKFCLGEKDNKLLNREVKTSDHLDMYTSKVNHTNARVNIDMQSKRAAGVPYMGYAGGYPQSSNLLIQKHGRDNLLRAPFTWQ